MKTRPILLVVLTLVIGIVLGMLTSAQIRFHKLKPVRLYFSEERFREGFFNTIQPDEKQKAEIEKILDKYAKLNSELQNNFRKELDSNMKELRKELDSMLTKEQLARLKEMDERRQEMIRQNRRDHNDDSSNFRGRRGRETNGRQFPGGRPMQRTGRPQFHPQDSVKSTDNK
jgi:hypothetical protein